MTPRIIGALSLIIALMTGAAANAADPVRVTFLHPEAYTDASFYGGRGIKSEEPALIGIRRCLEKLGARYLTPHRSVAIDVLNIDLAGKIEPWRPNTYDLRLMRDVYPPRITLRYRLTENARILGEGEETVTDVDDLANPASRGSHDPLRYEKAMLATWFRSRLLVRASAQSGLTHDLRWGSLSSDKRSSAA